MTNFFKKTMFAGLGLAFLTKGKVVEICKELVAIEKLSEKEGEELFKELTVKSEDAKKEIKTHVEKVVHDTVKKMNIVGKGSKEFLHGVSEKSEHVKDEIKGYVEKIVKETILKMNLVTHDDLNGLDKKATPPIKTTVVKNKAASKKKASPEKTTSKVNSEEKIAEEKGKAKKEKKTE